MAVRRFGRSLIAAACAAACATASGGIAPSAAGAQPPDVGGPRRERLERLAGVVQRRLGLTDVQARRLRATSARFGRQRQALVADERAARQTLRAEVQRGPDADQARLRAALDALVAAQQRRSALLAAEQRELAGFLTPLQRAQYLGLQERALRAAQRARNGRFGGGPSDTADVPPRFRRRGPV